MIAASPRGTVPTPRVGRRDGGSHRERIATERDGAVTENPPHVLGAAGFMGKQTSFTWGGAWRPAGILHATSSLAINGPHCFSVASSRLAAPSGASHRLDAIRAILDAFPGPSRRGGTSDHTGRVPGGPCPRGARSLGTRYGSKTASPGPHPGVSGRLGGRLDEVSRGTRGTTRGHPAPQRSRNQRKPPPRGPPRRTIRH
jgi:hypothetical protein